VTRVLVFSKANSEASPSRRATAVPRVVNGRTQKASGTQHTTGGPELTVDTMDVDLALEPLGVDDEDAGGAHDEAVDVGPGARDPAAVEGVDLGHDHQGLRRIVLTSAPVRPPEERSRRCPAR
jgi:hypothetical protein